jgi:hypothetical protein
MVAVAVGSRLYAKVSDLDDLPPTLMDEMGQFFHQLQQNARPCVQVDCPARRGRRIEISLVEYRVIRHVSD